MADSIITTRWWERRAGRLQAAVRWDEARAVDQFDQYSSAEVRQAVIHARQDVVLTVSLLSSLNGQMCPLLILVAVQTAAVVAMACRVFGLI